MPQSFDKVGGDLVRQRTRDDWDSYPKHKLHHNPAPSWDPDPGVVIFLPPVGDWWLLGGLVSCSPIKAVLSVHILTLSRQENRGYPVQGCRVLF